MFEEMRADERVFVYGEDIAKQGGIFGQFAGMKDEFPERVLDTPISETALVGAGVGAAIAGAKPVIDLHFADFIGIAMDEVLNQMAKAHYMFGGQATMSLVLRAPDGLMKHGAAQHSQSLETWFTNIPGIRVVVPSTPANGKQLLKAAIKDPNPVIYFENKGLFPVKGDVPEDLPPIDLSRAQVVREGADVTLVSYGLMLTKALAAADVARREYGVSVSSGHRVRGHQDRRRGRRDRGARGREPFRLSARAGAARRRAVHAAAVQPGDGGLRAVRREGDPRRRARGGRQVRRRWGGWCCGSGG